MSSFVNGDKPKSLTVDHITSYKVPSDLINMYQSNPLGAKSISVFNSFYDAFYQNLFPYLKTPYSIAAPYLEQVDHIGDNTLSQIDQRFPAIKETDLNGVSSKVQSVIFLPFRVAGQSKDYVFSRFYDEYGKVGGDPGIVRLTKTVISTELRIASEVVQTAAAYLGPKKDEAQQYYESMKKQGGEEFEKIKNLSAAKLDEAMKFAESQKVMAQKTASEKAQQAQDKGNELANGN